MSILTFKEELERRGHQVHIFAPGEAWSHGTGETRYKGYRIWNYPDARLTLWPFRHPTTQLLREGGFDLVHVQSFGPVSMRGAAAARKLSLPVVFSYHTYVPGLASYVAPRFLLRRAHALAWRFTEGLFRNADLVLVPGPSMAEEIRANVLSAELPRILVQPSGIDTARFHPDARSEEVRARLAPNGERVAVYVGRLAREKGLDALLELFHLARRETDDIVLAIGGKGEEREHLERLAARLRIEDSVRFLGFVPDAELPALYASADVFVTPSTSETQGITTLEAMACGTPVVAAAARGSADFVRDGETGRLFAPGDAEAGARAMLEVMEARESYREAARAHAVGFSVERMTDLLESRYAELAGKLVVVPVPRRRARRLRTTASR